MPYDVRMVINWRKVFKVTFKSPSKCSCRFIDIFLVSPYSLTLVLLYLSTFLCDGVFVFSGHWEVLHDIASLEVQFYVMLVANDLEASTAPFDVIYNENVVSLVAIWCVAGIGVIGVVIDVAFDFQLPRTQVGTLHL